MELTTKQGFKQTEVGLIPEDWSVKKFKDIFRVNQGLQIPIQQRLKCPTPNSKKYITIQYLNDGKGVEYINDYSVSVCCSENDILMTRTGNTGMVITNVNGVFHNNFFKINYDRNRLDKNYIVFYLKQNTTQIRILEKAGTSTIPDLNHNDFYSLQIPLPPTLKEQKAIATALSDVDNLITSLENLIAKKQAIKQGAMQQLLTPPHKGGKRLPGFSGDWVEKKLGNLGDCIIGLTYKPSNVANSGTLVLRSSNIQNDQLAFDDNVYVQMDIPDKLRTQMDDLLICVRNGSRSLIGKCARIDGRCVNQSFGAFMSIYRSPYNKFITHVFKSYSIQKQIEKNLGATINQITNKVLNSFKIWFPVDEKERNQVSIFLDDMDKEIEQLETKKAKYQQLKQGMLQELLTGNTRLV
ncbi:restriction endonuclease subunit S [Tenacibaculum maritimum]|uniref:restriction endonuclease subunit S n=1 Tax=Tenacibaculum maritimum TaxID=107401 RepID=UPI00387699D5